MRLSEALAIAQKPADGVRSRSQSSSPAGSPHCTSRRSWRPTCGSPSPAGRVDVRTGLYGDCLGNLERLGSEPVYAAAVILEWSDLDPRLGLRQLGGWKPSDLGDILEGVTARLGAYRKAIELASGRAGVAVCTPTLPLPPVSHTPGWQAGAFDLEIRLRIPASPRGSRRRRASRVVNPQRLDQASPPPDRLDVKSEWRDGFPYKMTHADVLAGLLARLARYRVPKKGLITDLDDTFWSGLVGEVGPGEFLVAGAPQSGPRPLPAMLASLAAAGVLVAVASKNDRGSG